MKQVSKQEAVINSLNGKVDSLEQCNYQNQLLLSGVQSQLYRISKQLNSIGFCGGVDAHDDSIVIPSDNSSEEEDGICLMKEIPHRSSLNPTNLYLDNENEVRSSSPLFPALSLASESSESSDCELEKRHHDKMEKRKQSSNTVSTVIAATSKQASSVQNSPIAAPIDIRSGSKVLPSAAIDKSSLQSIDYVLEKFCGCELRYVGQKLAELVFFGPKVLAMCTPCGCSKTYPALPQEELYMLKQTLLDASPQYWDDLEEFEFEWKKRVMPSLAVVCAKLRLIKVKDQQQQEVSAASTH